MLLFSLLAVAALIGPACSCSGGKTCVTAEDCGSERICINGACGEKGETGACEGGAWVGTTTGRDLDGDGLDNDAECLRGLDPTQADTDGDGLDDGEEDGLGTDPLRADTDGDGLVDGRELELGTDPLNRDTDRDGLDDGIEIAARLDPLNPDTDGDRLEDGEEGQYGTDPTVADTDGDGLVDGDEVDLGYDPLDPSDPDNSVKCDVLATCAQDALKPMAWEEQGSGDTRIALETTFAHSRLVFSNLSQGERANGAAFDDAAAGVAGLLLSIDEPISGGDPNAQLTALAGRLGSGSWPWTFVERITGRTVTSWDGYPAMVSARFNFTAAGSNAGAIRDALAASLSDHAPADISGLPAVTSFAPGGEFVFGFEILVRRNGNGDAGRIVILGAVTDKASYDDKALQARIRVADLGNGTALGQHGDRDNTRCDSFVVESDPRADFIWMSDISGSTNDERMPIKSSATMVFDALANLGVDARMAVMPHENNSINSANPGQFYAPGFTRDAGTFGAWWDIAGGDGQEYGLLAVNDAIRPGGRAMPRSATEVADKVREGVKLVVVYVSDEHDQSVEAACAGVQDRNKTYVPDAAGQQCIDSTVQPFVDVLLAESAIAFGVIAESPGGCANPTNGTSSQEAGWGYKEVIEATGGSYGSVCASDPGQTLDDIVNAVAGAASAFQLTGAPISATLKVVVTPAGLACDPQNPTAGRREVPRSALDGFDYDPVSNSIFFLGTSRPQIGDGVTVSYREWEDRTSNPNPDPGGCDGTCNPTCEAGFTCQADSCTCVPDFG
ncbi:MAG: hypothetical protein P1V51_03345 [Deltaproteobacteria bacterium]|nr:hypothetical protein [Deltaproteobacteria bacterium]